MPISDRGAQNLSKEIEITDAAGTNAHRFSLAEDEYGRLLWDQGSVPAEGSEPGEELIKTWDYFGGGMGETHDLQELLGIKTGAYYYSSNCQVSNPYAIRPRQETTSVTLTGNVKPPTWFFEAVSASGQKYLYVLTDTKAFKIQLSDCTLVNTKDFGSTTVEFATGSYLGTGGSQTISLPFTPKGIIIKDNLAGSAVFKSDQMATYSWKLATGTYTAGDTTTGLAISGADLNIYGSPTGVNVNHATYRYVIFGGADAYVKTGKFSGDGTDNRDITIATSWGQPDALFIWTNNTSDEVCFKPKDATTDVTWLLGQAAAAAADRVQATAGWPTDGFEVGTDNDVNRSGTDNVFYLALKEDTSILKVSSYTGNGGDDRSITDPAFDPTYALVCCAEAAAHSVVHRSDKCAGDATMYFTATADAADLIQSLITNGFQVGGAVDVNKDAQTYYYMACRPNQGTDVIHGQPAKWNSIWEKPNGDNVDFQGLTTIVDGTGNDTWTTRTGLKATHFCVVENELIRAYGGRTLIKLSSTDIATAGNWSGAYNVGQPGTVITKLVNMGGEVGIGATDGFYLWDTVSVSRQQLPLLAGVSDAENAKGMTVLGNLVLIPTVDGEWRWVAGSAAQIGPDANRFYTTSKGPTNVPIRLRHYGHAFLGTYVYNAVYDGTNYYILYTRLDPNHPTLLGSQWDFLYGTAQVWPETFGVKELFIDTDRRLWFGKGISLSYMQLSRGGAPEGGNWASSGVLAGSFYLPETDLGTPALKRLRLVEVAVRNSATNFSWRAAVHRDGATAENVGDSITTDGVAERFWTAGTNDTARRVRPWVYYAITAYTPTTTSPEVYRVTLHAEALDEDADLIVCSIKLTGNAKEQTAIIDGHLNAGPMKLKNPFTGTKETVVLYRRRLYSLRQQGNSPPIAACELRFRRSDVA